LPRFALVLILIALCLVAGPSSAADAGCDDGPTALRHKHPGLQALLDRGLRDAGLAQALDRRKLAVALVDASRPGEIFYAGINDDNMLYAASLPKIGILLAVIESVERGTIEWDDEFRYKLRKMITISNNQYATWGAELVGLRPMAKILLDPRYCLYEGGVGGLWVGRPFKKGGPSYRDPLKSISHGASARQVARFYVLLDRGRLVSRYWSNYMLRLMAPPEYFHKFVAALQDRERLDFVARKSGTWQHFHSDSVLVQHGPARYVLVGLAEHEDGEAMLRRVAPVADDIVLAGRHRTWLARPTQGWRHFRGDEE
jgi:beta-lactamase class A